jgi:hypothetical protein
MKKKLGIVVIALICSTFLVSGCGLLGELKKTVEEPKEKVYGTWYDTDTKTYLVMNHDQTYTMGFGMNAVNSGGTYTIDNEHIVLKIDYAIADGIKEDVPAPNKEDIICTYRLTMDDALVLKTGDGTVLKFKSVPSSRGENTMGSSNQMELAGLWKNIKVDESIYFDGKGEMTRSLTDSKTKGRYEIKVEQITVTIDGIQTTYVVKYLSATRIELTNKNKAEDIQYYEKMGE